MEMSPGKRTFRDYLEVVTNAAVLLMAVTIASIFLRNNLMPQQPPPLRTALQRGQTVSQVPGVNFHSAPKTLLIALNTKCGYCAASVPFYNRLADSQKNGGESIRIVALFPNKEEEVQQFVGDRQLKIETLASVNYSTLAITGTPTMLLVNKDGQLTDFWIGSLSAEVEQEVLNSL